MSGKNIFLFFVLAAVLAAQAPARKKHFTLRGKVQGVNQMTRSLTINHDKVEGWRDAATMTYALDDEKVLDRVKVGDQIQATVYEGDYKLYDVRVANQTEQPPPKPAPKKAKS